jgi:hypothetical protein
MGGNAQEVSELNNFQLRAPDVTRSGYKLEN